MIAPVNPQRRQLHSPKSNPQSDRLLEVFAPFGRAKSRSALKSNIAQFSNSKWALIETTLTWSGCSQSRFINHI